MIANHLAQRDQLHIRKDCEKIFSGRRNVSPISKIAQRHSCFGFKII